jgi:hypothetical protein
MPPDDISFEKLRSAVPFSSCGGRREIVELCRTLLHDLGLEGDIDLQQGSAEQVVSMEAFYRRRWWLGAEDPVREALQGRKFQALNRVGKERAVREAWAAMTLHVNSPLWREQFRRVSSTSNQLQAHLLRLAFRSAQQVWTRAARFPAAI